MRDHLPPAQTRPSRTPPPATHTPPHPAGCKNIGRTSAAEPTRRSAERDLLHPRSPLCGTRGPTHTCEQNHARSTRIIPQQRSAYPGTQTGSAANTPVAALDSDAKVRANPPADRTDGKERVLYVNRFLLGLVVSGLIVGCSPAEVSESTTSASVVASTTSAPPAEAEHLRERIVELAAEVTGLRTRVAELEQTLQDSRSETERISAQEAELRGIFESAQVACEAERVRYEEELTQLRGLASLPDTPEVRSAVSTLERFLSAMRTGDYATAAELYAGSLDTVIDWNPTVDASDHVALLEAACNQLLCDLRVRRVLPGLITGDSYQFWVEFETSAGVPFTRGPCCGDDSSGPPETQFPFTVIAQDGAFRVTTLPVYVP